MIATLLNKISHWIYRAINRNFRQLFNALDTKNWGQLKQILSDVEITKLAHKENNRLLFSAIFEEQYELAHFLLQLDNVKNDPSLDSYMPLMHACLRGEAQAAIFMLEHIPSIAQHVAVESNTLLINAVYQKQWTLVFQLSLDPEVQKNLSDQNIQYICDEMIDEDEVTRGFMAHLLLKIPAVYQHCQKTLNKNDFDDLLSMSELYAKKTLGYSIEENEAIPEKNDNFLLTYNETQRNSRKRITPPEQENEIQDAQSKKHKM